MKPQAPFKRRILLGTKGRSSHYVCFDCRKQFAKPTSSIVVRDALGKPMRAGGGFDSGAAEFKCPQCGHPMTHLGKNFRAPVQSDAEGWEVARRLVNAGFRYAHAWGPYPTRLRDVPAFIEQNSCKSAGERLLDQWKGQS
ncbi:hypothetical protein [Deinococcus sp. 12RED42]|uniref:hypothetical protein n=1 Tax=Deinococcus sp. 12RED42 TaxID=2745872 RepID=UPI001E346B6D|nr:hypothetical protein [Deinococcus sp. 12RED42]MCD0164924.1 hypothetical protein [Deinococcus sp. 12RED42]